MDICFQPGSWLASKVELWGDVDARDVDGGDDASVVAAADVAADVALVPGTVRRVIMRRKIFKISRNFAK